MKMYTLGTTGITVPQNAFGALPIQRVSVEAAVALLRRAYLGGMRFFDTARAYSDSEVKMGAAFTEEWRKSLGIAREDYYIASKTQATAPERFWEDLSTTLTNLKTEYLDIYQFHCVNQCFRPGDGTGMYEAMQEAKDRGLIRHIGITAHKIGIAEEIVESGLYETLQFPFSYLASERELRLVQRTADAGMGFIAMKGLSGGLLTNSAACMAFMLQYPVLPIWGIQREEELDQWLSFFQGEPADAVNMKDRESGESRERRENREGGESGERRENREGGESRKSGERRESRENGERVETVAVITPELQAVIDRDRAELLGDFCRGCGYCMPCTVGIQINNCARMSQLIRRAPSKHFLGEEWQGLMGKIEECTNCGQCKTRCPYGLDIPVLLKKNLEDYREILKDPKILG